SSYRPSLFWEFKKPKEIRKPFYLRAGYEHESNGQAGSTSRSIDTLFFLPVWEVQFKERSMIIGPKIYFYISKGNHNKDIEEFRGFSDLILRYGNEENWIINFLLRHSLKGKYAFQLDFSYPIRNKIFSRAGGYLYFQGFYGYGETLLTYNKKEGFNFRFGFAIVR
ncbi:MAG: phospholipase A, partial [Thermoanaerobaculia bacterium]